MKRLISQKGMAQLWMLVGLVVMAVALPVASMLVGKSQDNRNRAAGGSICVYDNVTQKQVCFVPTSTPLVRLTATPYPTATPSPWPSTEDCTNKCSTGYYCVHSGTADRGSYACVAGTQPTFALPPTVTPTNTLGTAGVGALAPTRVPTRVPTKIPTKVPTSAPAVKCTSAGQTCIKNDGKLGTCQGYNTASGFNGICVTVATPTTVAACFLSGTQIKTSVGMKNIDEIKVGEEITSFEDDKVKSSVVTKVFSLMKDNYFEIETTKNKVEVTGEHPFYVGGGKFVEVKDLKVGDRVVVLVEGRMEMTEVMKIRKIEKQVRVFNLEVDKDHTFFANGFAVHNKNVMIFGCEGFGFTRQDPADLCMKKYAGGKPSQCVLGSVSLGTVKYWGGSGGIAKTPTCLTANCCVEKEAVDMAGNNLCAIQRVIDPKTNQEATGFTPICSNSCGDSAYTVDWIPYVGAKSTTNKMGCPKLNAEGTGTDSNAFCCVP